MGRSRRRRRRRGGCGGWMFGFPIAEEAEALAAGGFSSPLDDDEASAAIEKSDFHRATSPFLPSFVRSFPSSSPLALHSSAAVY